MKIQKGNWIAKKNGRPFAQTNQKAIKIQRYQPMNLPGEYKINGRFQLLEEHIEVLSPEEAAQMNAEFQNLKVSVNRNAGMFSHIREATGEPKVAYESAESCMRVLDEMRRKYPDKHFEGYLCSICGKFHIGTLQDIDLVLPKVEQDKSMEFVLKIILGSAVFSAVYYWFVPEHNIYTIGLLVLVLTLSILYSRWRFKKFRE